MIAFLLALTSAACQVDDVAPAPGSEAVAAALDPWIAREVAKHDLPSLSIALVSGQSVVWAKGYGMADPARRRPATAGTVYRVGSVSKLITDLTVMHLVEAGRLDIDRPVVEILPQFHPANPFGTPVTLRHLMAHRSGLVREAPIGSYLDPTEPTPEAVVESLNPTTLVDPPGTRTKYSNAGIHVVGTAAARASGKTFAEAAKEVVLGPLGMASSGFGRDHARDDRRVHSVMWTGFGREFPAPEFVLGTVAAGELESTVLDLAKLLAWIHRGGGDGVVRPETLASMFVPQFRSDADPRPPFGLGFAVGTFDGHRKVGHSGAVYGNATDFACLPDDGLGVAVAIGRDCANDIAAKIAAASLRALLAQKAGRPIPTPPEGRPLPSDAIPTPMFYRDDAGTTVELFRHRGAPILWGASPLRWDLALAPDGRWMADGPLGSGRIFDAPGPQGLRIGDRTFRPLPEPPRPPEPPAAIADVVGEYGWDHIPLMIVERDGRLFALIEWFFLYPLLPDGADSYKFDDSGMYQRESLTFRRDGAGKVVGCTAAGIPMPRRAFEGTFRVVPTRPVAELRAAALAATPPAQREGLREPDLVDLATLDPAIKFDIRYATANNFLGTPFYDSPRAFLQRPAAEALLAAHRSLAPFGYGILVHDAYRPWSVTKMFWDGVDPKYHGFVADPAKGSKHNRGCAVDLTLYELESGRPVVMPSGYDEFSDRAYPDYLGGTSAQRWRRWLLRRAMESRGFAVDASEWWHYDFRDWDRYPVSNATFERLGRP